MSDDSPLYMCKFCCDYSRDNSGFIINGMCPRCRDDGITLENMHEFAEYSELPDLDNIPSVIVLRACGLDDE